MGAGASSVIAVPLRFRNSFLVSNHSTALLLLEAYDAVIVSGSVIATRHQAALRRFVRAAHVVEDLLRALQALAGVGAVTAFQSDLCCSHYARRSSSVRPVGYIQPSAFKAFQRQQSPLSVRTWLNLARTHRQATPVSSTTGPSQPVPAAPDHPVGPLSMMDPRIWVHHIFLMRSGRACAPVSAPR